VLLVTNIEIAVRFETDALAWSGASVKLCVCSWIYDITLCFS